MTDATTIIPGHGEPTSGRAELQTYRDMLVAVRETVGDMKNQGRTLDEVIAAGPTRELDPKWGQFVVSGANFTKLVYAGL